jgi:PTH1 family peptidyl-tRNA hydrolase
VLGSRDFWRLRIGIDHPGDRGQVIGYVLGRPSQEDGACIRDALDRAREVTQDLLAGRYQAAMSSLHSGR